MMHRAAVCDQIRGHIEIIARRSHALIQNGLNPDDEDIIRTSQANAAQCLALLKQARDLPPQDQSDFLNHHVRNLLTPIHGYTQMIEMYSADQLAVEQLEDLQHIERAVRDACEDLKAFQRRVGSANYTCVDIA
jgi:light-regulated signal transduction histidine kinase (bacteriophytochrome)